MSDVGEKYERFLTHNRSIQIGAKFEVQKTPEEKRKEKDKIKRDVEEYLAKGGTITHVPEGESGYEHLNVSLKAVKARKLAKNGQEGK